MNFFKNKLATILICVAVLILLVFIFGNGRLFNKTVEEQIETKEEAVEVAKEKFIGQSTLGNDITAYTYGTGDTEILLVGGIHGGYEWNTVTLAYKMKSYLEANPSLIPENLKVTVIPVLNPDGLEKVVGTAGEFALSAVPSAEATIEGRFNANEVDLNRNFDCDWQPTSTWRSKTVSAGTAAFSEPEAAAFRDYVVGKNIAGVLFWHSAGNGVYASRCGGDVLPETTEMMNAFALDSGYPAYNIFDQYVITGDSADWLAKIGVPGITVELNSHDTVEFEQNLAGVKALIEYYAKR